MPESSALLRLKQSLEMAFVPRDFQGMWYGINAKYKALDFKDNISDSIRIQEYKYIVHQFRRYIANKREAIMSCESAEDMIMMLNSMYDNSDEYGEERKVVVYNFLRDDWIMEVIGYIQQFLYEQAENEEVE